MFDCKNLEHPFQNDPGCSQSQRDMEELLSGQAKLDGRSLIDLLNYFTEYASHLKYTSAYYDVNERQTMLNENENWQSFFKTSIPFLLAAATKDNADALTQKFQLYNQLFTKQPSERGLQLLIHFVYYSTVYRINNLFNGIKDSKLPIVTALQKLTTDKLQAPLRTFIETTYSACSLLCIKYIEFEPVYSQTGLWGIKRSQVVNGNAAINSKAGRDEQLLAFQDTITTCFNSFAKGMGTIAAFAEANVQQSLIPLQDDLKQKHPPHLALVFTFISIFSNLQNDLNGYTKKHLDFFYKDVLRLKPKDATPDEMHLVFELQKQLKQYVLKKGLLAKADKDINNAEIDFALDDEIVVNKTQVTDLRTLFINNEALTEDKFYVEGAYMAVKANTLDGIDKDFTDDPKNYPTLGDKYSKYIAPGTNFFHPYPSARLGFILASPVLLLQEGLRTITIKLTCKYRDEICNASANPAPKQIDECCKKDKGNVNDKVPLADEKKKNVPDENYPGFLGQDLLFKAMQEILPQTYVHITESLLNKAVASGVSEGIAETIRKSYLTDDCKKSVCCGKQANYKLEASVPADEFWNLLKGEDATKDILSTLFPQHRPLSISFSGEKGWVVPDFITDPNNLKISLKDKNADGTFDLLIEALIKADQPSITWYNKDNLGEDFNTILPLSKILLNDDIKVPLGSLINALNSTNSGEACCLTTKKDLCGREISTYHFFRTLDIADTTIDVAVCGLKNIIVQNDENVQDVNSPIYAFGTRPKVSSNFYIGSKEIFSKTWKSLFINVTWKDRPEHLDDYYSQYSVGEKFEDNSDDITEHSFKIDAFVLEDGRWISNGEKELFGHIDDSKDSFCRDVSVKLPFNQNVYLYTQNDFPGYGNKFKPVDESNFTKLTVNSQYGFLRLALDGVSFQHDLYPFVLARYMMKLFEGADPVKLALARTTSETLKSETVPALEAKIQLLKQDIHEITTHVNELVNDGVVLGGPPSPGSPASVNTLVDLADNLRLASDALHANNIPSATNLVDASIDILDNTISPLIQTIKLKLAAVRSTLTEIGDSNSGILKDLKKEVESIHENIKTKDDNGKELKNHTPPEPYTPVISSISLDYTATATKLNVDLIHLYPYQNTFKKEEITLAPPLFPTFCDEGTLFIGLSELVPGENVNMLFQLAEATSDSESDPQIVYWSYLNNNSWLALREGFEILNDATDNLTRSGIIKFALPENMSADNTVMPKNTYWIKASVPKNSKAVCETLGIYTQAAKATFAIDPANDTSRLSTPLAAQVVSKLQVADANIKQVTQPYASFNGREPEATKHYYIRVSELLRHKGRAIQKFDYERLTLEAFPQVYKAKCINHSFKMDADEYFNDFPFAPGYVLVAIIPDLTKLFAGKSFEPKAPTGLLEEIEDYLSKRSSPFVRIKAVNPRYEKIDFCISIVLRPGFDEIYYKEELAKDLREFLAPWAVGNYDKLSFGECVNKSDVVHFIETREYVDYITRMEIKSEQDPAAVIDFEICPTTPRSILLAGEIHICIGDGDDEQLLEDKCQDTVYIEDYCEPVKPTLV
ncbi:baseplate J/gp47 family protein [Chitinophagaceae bacterium 26-R-25]|nr:baseplate J/gp47 family protein [Chitinophagaceae bacterium 26-R-25]